MLADSQGTLHSPLNKDDFCQKSNTFVVVIHYFILKTTTTESLWFSHDMEKHMLKSAMAR